MFGQGRRNLFKVLGLPETFGVILFTLALVLALSPYLGGREIGSLAIPQFSPDATRVLHIVGPLMVLFVVLASVPIWPTGRLLFEKIRVAEDNPYWKEWNRTRDGAPRINPEFPRRLWSTCKQFFHINEAVAHADPSFDVTLRNNADRKTLIYAVGVRVVRVAQYSFELPIAGEEPEARPLKTSKAYWLRMPDIWEQTKHLFFDELDPPADIDQLVKKDCYPPYILPRDGSFRYTLVLGNYSLVPNNAVLRMWVQTSEGDHESHELFLRYALGY